MLAVRVGVGVFGVKNHTVHTCQELRDNSAFHLALCAFSFWCDRVNLVDE